MRELIMAADLGASKILCAIATPDGQILARKKLPTPGDQGPDVVLDRICSCLEALGKEVYHAGDCWKGVAVATPGPLAYPSAIVLDSPNLHWKEVAIRDELSRRLDRAVVVEKDTNMAVLGEYIFGQGSRCRHILYITVSTGIGGGLLLEGNLYRGASGGAGEVGHMIVVPDGYLCGCGRRGCLEAVASGSAVAREAEALRGAGWGREYGFPEGAWGAKEVGEAARRGDPQAVKLVNRVSDHLGTAIASLINILNPQLVVLGGSMALGWQGLLEPVLEPYVKNQVFSLNGNALRVAFTSLGEDIVLLGCVAAVKLKES